MAKKMSSAEKEAIISEKNRLRNRAAKSRIKTAITRAEKLIGAKDKEQATVAAATAQVELDKAAQKGIIHPNNTARHKSRLAKKLNQL